MACHRDLMARRDDFNVLRINLAPARGRLTARRTDIKSRWAGLISRLAALESLRVDLSSPAVTPIRRIRTPCGRPPHPLRPQAPSPIFNPMPDRRYDDQEVAAIFRAAAEGPSSLAQQPSHDDGLTLAELRSIGREAGLDEAEVERAARVLDLRVARSDRSLLGLPIGVSRSVDLGRRITDEEWERLVVRFREVFHARGAVRADGSLRQWTNGNLQVLLEPTETGQRVRFATTHGGARASIAGGLGALGIAAISALTLATGGTLASIAPSLVFLGGAGLGMIANGALRLPGWARRRRQQMDALAAEIALPPR